MSSDSSKDIEPHDKLPANVKANTLGKLGVVTFIKSLVDLFKSRRDRVLNQFPPTQAQDYQHPKSTDKDDSADQRPGRNS